MADVVRKADTTRSWLVCLAASVTLTFTNGSYYSFGLLMPPLMTLFRRSNATTAWTGSLYISLGYLFAPVVTRITRRLGFQLTAIGGALLLSVSFLACSFADHFWLFFFLFSIPTGLGSAISYHCATLVVLRQFVKWRSLAVGILASTSSVGMLVMPLITEELLSKYGLQNTLRGWAILFLLTAPLACTYISRPEVEDGIMAEEEDDPSQPPSEKSRSSLLRNGWFTTYLASVSIVSFAVFTPSVYMVKFCESELSIPTHRASLLYTYMAIAAFFSNHFFCKLSEMKLKVFDTSDLYHLAMSCFGICLLLLPLATSFNVMVAFSVLFGLMDGGRYGLMPLLVLESVGSKKTDQAWGCLSFSVGFAFCFGPVIIGCIADSAGSYGPAFLTAGAIAVIGSSLVLFRHFIERNDSTEEKVESQRETYV